MWKNYFCSLMAKTGLSLLAALLLSTGVSFAQSGAFVYEMQMLKKDVFYLASDALEGRRTGTRGEELARQYLEKRYRQMDIPAWKKSYTQPFTFVEGRAIGSGNMLYISGKSITDTSLFFPLPWSGNGEAKGYTIAPLFKDTAELSNPHFDWHKEAYDKAKALAKNGAKAVVFTAPPNAKETVRFNAKSDLEALDIPVAVYFTDAAVQPSGNDPLKVNVIRQTASAANFAAYLDNGAKYTIVVGAHYDHLGHGEDGNSLLANAGKLREIHNGADDNASGTAGLMMLAQRIRNEGKKAYNYLFLHFSGEELGLLGSKAFVKQSGLDSTNTAAMINLDMIGRLPDSRRALQIGGVGTSPVWASLLPEKGYKISVDSSGIGPSDHTSFYTAGIPVLFFFTGAHSDYHKPTDDADKVNFVGIHNIIGTLDTMLQRLDKLPKPRFTATRNVEMGKARFKVTLGIMPDYSFTEGGVRVDGVMEGRPAAKAGVKAGDIIVQLGDHKIGGMQSYMEALGSFKSGQTVPLKMQRAGKIETLSVTF